MAMALPFGIVWVIGTVGILCWKGLLGRDHPPDDD
jgi:hypothetical protein